MAEVTVICNPVDGFAPNVPGCTRDHCHICAAEVWVAPSSREIEANHSRRGDRVLFLCSDCAPGVLDTEQHFEIALQPEQLREVREWLR